MKTKNSILLIAFIYLYFNLNAQTVLKGNISGLKDGSKVYLVSRNTQQKDSATVKHNQFRFNLNNINGEVLYLMLRKDYVIGKFLPIYLDKGIFNIEGNDSTIYNAKITGSPYAVDLDNYNTMLNSHHIIEESWRLGHQVIDAVKNNDTVAIAKINQKLQQSRLVWKKYGDEWIAHHLTSPISSFIIYLTVYRDSSKKVLEAELNKLAPCAKDNNITKEMLQAVEASKHNNITQIALDFTQADTAGHPVSLKTFRGKYVLIDFWASWCLPCRAENPKLVKVFEKYKDKNFIIFSVSLDKDKKDWIKAINNDKLNWINVSDLKFWSNQVAKLYDVKSMPTNILIDPSGKILAKDLGSNDLDRFLNEHL